LKRLLLAAVLVIGGGLPAIAQTQSSRVQIGGAFSSLGLDNATGEPDGHGGVGVRAIVRLTRRVAIDTRAVWFPGNADPRFQSQGGQSLQLAAGLRGKFVSKPRFSIYGVLLPELVRFTGAFVSIGVSDWATGSTTHFALDDGLGVEVYSRSRWTFWAEATGPLYLVDGVELFRSEPGSQGQVASASLAPEARNPWQLSIGANYQLGAVRTEPAAEQPVVGRFTIGGSLAHRTAISEPLEGLIEQTALGGFASFRICPGVYADGAIHIFTGSVPVKTPTAGGPLTQILAGGKFGTRKDGFGFFAKFRAGINSQSQVVLGSYPSIHLGRADWVAIDIGGVVERYVGSHIVIRFDGGDIFTSAEAVPSHRHSLNLSAGAGWRF